MIKSTGGKMKNLLVSDYMTGKTLSFTKKMLMLQAVDKIITSREHGGPVIDEHEYVIGWFSGKDSLGKMLEASYYGDTVTLVEDVMSCDIKTIVATMSIIDVAQLMLKTSHRIYAIVDENKQYVGTITRKNVLLAMTRQIKLD